MPPTAGCCIDGGWRGKRAAAIPDINRFLRCGVGVAILLVSACGPADELADFTTDGCSSFPDGTIEQKALWKYCCVVHDYAYWQGGSKEQRRQADESLGACVAQVGEPEIGRLMLAGVRVGGTPYLPTKFRWGYGWPWPRGYERLSVQEANLVEQKSRAALDIVREEAARHGFDTQAD